MRGVGGKQFRRGSCGGGGEVGCETEGKVVSGRGGKGVGTGIRVELE